MLGTVAWVVGWSGGSPVKRAGYAADFEELKARNLEVFDRFSARRIITNCPGCYHTLSSDYGLEAYHVTQVLDGRLSAAAEPVYVVPGLPDGLPRGSRPGRGVHTRRAGDAGSRDGGQRGHDRQHPKVRQPLRGVERRGDPQGAHLLLKVFLTCDAAY